MYTLPLTCKQILFTGVIIMIGIGITMTLLGLEEQGKVETSWFLVFGASILLTFAALGIAIGLIESYEWLSIRVKCKCDS